jgi:hypothetical protein
MDQYPRLEMLRRRVSCPLTTQYFSFSAFGG